MFGSTAKLHLPSKARLVTRINRHDNDARNLQAGHSRALQHDNGRGRYGQEQCRRKSPPSFAPLLPNRRVDCVSASLKLLGLQFTIKHVLLFPPREFWRAARGTGVLEEIIEPQLHATASREMGKATPLCELHLGIHRHLNIQQRPGCAS